jgi:hypothetical protein
MTEDKLTSEFLTELLAKEDVSADEKVKQILSEHEAYNRALVQKRDELLGSERKLKEQVASFANEKTGYESKIAELSERLKKNDPEANRQFYETQMADANAKHQAELKKVSDERDFYKQSHLTSLRDKAIEEGTKDLNFIEGLKDGFIARVLSLNTFEPKDINGELQFLNKDMHTIKEAINAFALTPEGKAYIRNPSSGGGAKGSYNPVGGTAKKTMSRAQFNELQSRDPQQVMKFFREGGRIQD